MSEEDKYSKIVKQIKSELETNTLIANKYGVILGSEIEDLNKGKIIPPEILDLINQRVKFAKSLKLKEIYSITLESEKDFFLITKTSELILLAQLKKSVDLSQLIPSVKKFLEKLAAGIAKKLEIDEFTKFGFVKEIIKLDDSLKTDEERRLKFNIIKDLIKYIS